MNILKEAFVSRKNDAGITKFLASDLNSPHIIEAIKLISKKAKVSEKELIDEILKEIAENEELLKKSPTLYKTAHKNLVESTVFHFLEKHKINLDDSSKFNVRDFYELVKLVKLEHKSFNPLRGLFSAKSLYNPVFIFVPTDKPEYKKYQSVTTAAATKTGHFIFNTEFMQRLLDYGHMIEVKAKGKKYKSNGGHFDDAWAYIEFLIIHEFMHFTQSDFHYKKILKADSKIINYVGDFRTNYLLVKSGFTQLPIGLYSDDVNYDRQHTYKEMYDLVKAELEKLSDKDKENLEKIFKKLMDEHGEGGEGEDGDGGEGEDGDVENVSPEEAHKRINQAGKDKEKELGNRTERGESEPEQSDSKAKPSKGSGENANKKFDPASITPKFNWKTLLEKFVKKAYSSEDSYSKPNRKNITALHRAHQGQPASIKPGELKTESVLNLAIVIDSSGSMHQSLNKVYSEIKALLSHIENPNFIIIKFSDSFNVYQCNTKENTYKKDKKVSRGLNTLFSETINGGTNFSATLAAEIKTLHDKEFGVIVLSDTDILHGYNFKHLKSVLNFQNFGLIFDSKDSFSSFVTTNKTIPNNVSYFS